MQNDKLLPEFPPKKYFGTTDPEFLKQRSEKMALFFKAFLLNAKVRSCPSVFGFFLQKAANDESREAIEKFIAYMSGKEDLALPSVD